MGGTLAGVGEDDVFLPLAGRYPFGRNLVDVNNASVHAP